MWIFSAGLQRSGSTLQYQIVSEIVERTNKGERSEHPMGKDFVEIKSKYSDENKFYIFKTHKITPSIKDEIEKNNAKVICIYRDIRDVFVSMKNKFKYNDDDLFNSKFVEKYIEEYNEWLSVKGIYLSKYEDIVVDIRKEISSVAKYLNIEISSKTIEEIAKLLSLEKQKKRLLWPKIKYYLFGRKSWEKKSQLHWNHINSGEVGQWRGNLNEETIKKIELIAKDWLIQNNYELQYK